jgi:UDP-hydrolysing UDP-N-acetyl-D-glucosamine 2-epimerase
MKVAIILVDRANYGRMKPVMDAMKRRPEAFAMSVVCAGTMVLERFGLTMEVVRDDGFDIAGEVFLELEGSIPHTMAKSLGIGILEFSNEFRRLEPDLVLMIGDRYEALAATLAAAYMNLTIAHIQGGEVSGSVDERARHAITKFAHYHFPSTTRAAEYLVRMGEDPATVLAVGCPSSDLARDVAPLRPELLNGRGSGAVIDPNEPFLLVLFHPDTTAYGSEVEQIRALLAALVELSVPTFMLWPNIDAGSSHISKEIRKFRDRVRPEWLRIQTNLQPSDYLSVLAGAAVAVGNSSSFCRDAGFFGTPVVLVGTRQDGREADEHVTRVGEVRVDAVVDATRAQLAHGRYAPSTLYGDGEVAERIAASLVGVELLVQKRLFYIHDPV